MIEPRAAEHQLAQPVDERLAADKSEPLPVADEVPAEPGARLDDLPVRGDLDEVTDLLVVEVVRSDQAESDGRGGDSLLEIESVEAEAVAEELDDVVLA